VPLKLARPHAWADAVAGDRAVVATGLLVEQQRAAGLRVAAGEQLAPHRRCRPGTGAVLVDPVHVDVVLGQVQCDAWDRRAEGLLFARQVRGGALDGADRRDAIAHLDRHAVFLERRAEPDRRPVVLRRNDGRLGIALARQDADERGRTEGQAADQDANALHSAVNAGCATTRAIAAPSEVSPAATTRIGAVPLAYRCMPASMADAMAASSAR